MRVTKLLGEIVQHGIEVKVSSGQLFCRPRQALTPDILAAVREHKHDIVRHVGLLADPVRMCKCGTRIVPGVPGGQAGRCYYCWKTNN